jgi:HrpA-like RNA helicase
LKAKQEEGDILAFLTGQGEIEALEKLLITRSKMLPEGTLKVLFFSLPVLVFSFVRGVVRKRIIGNFFSLCGRKLLLFDLHASSINKNQIEPCPLYGAQTTHRQQKVFLPTPPGCRKVVLCTNIAETSVTVPSIKYDFFNNPLSRFVICFKVT